MTLEKHHVWSERYRPRRVADCILPEKTKAYFQSIVDGNKLPHMTLVGGPGTGKTSLARALCEEMGVSYIIINASEEGNIETIRTKVRQFASTVSFDGNMKCVILDEADGLTFSAQNALRGITEELSKNCAFIFTGNYANRISDAIQSRAPTIEFSIAKEDRRSLILQFLARVKEVLTEEGIEHSNEELTSVVLKNFPDYRRTWNLIQRFSKTGKLVITSQLGISSELIKELVGFLRDKEFGKMRKWVVDNLDNDAAALRRELYEGMADHVNPSSIPQLVLILAEYDYKEAHVMDKEINAVAMLTTLMADIHWR